MRNVLFYTLNANLSELVTLVLALIFVGPSPLLAVQIAVMLQIAVVYVPLLQKAFGTFPLTLRDWGCAVVGAGGLFALEETRKVLFPKLYSLGKYQPAKGNF